jgi:hypothetical protein
VLNAIRSKTSRAGISRKLFSLFGSAVKLMSPVSGSMLVEQIGVITYLVFAGSGSKRQVFFLPSPCHAFASQPMRIAILRG